MKVDLGIEAPLLPARLGVESDDAIERGAQIHRAVGDDGCGLEFALAAIITAVGDIAGVVFPGVFWFCDVALVNLSQGRIASAASIPAVKGPIGNFAIRSRPGCG